MKKLVLTIMFFAFAFSMHAQSQEAQQLLLNWEKLAQLRSILNNMYKGYQVVSKGYTTIKDVSQGNYKLHQVFLDGLLEVSPMVKKYYRVGDIISYQQKIMEEQKKAFHYFKETGQFSPAEIEYMGKVYGKIFNQSLENLDELSMIVTAGQLRMSDDERLQAIDRIFEDLQGKLGFLKSFNNSTKLLAVQRAKEQREVNLSRKLSGIR